MKKTTVIAIGMSLLLGINSLGTAQDEKKSNPLPPVQGDSIIIAADATADGGAITSFQLVGPPGMDTGQFFVSPGMGSMGSDPWTIVNNPQIQAELDLVDNQKKELRQLQRDYHKQISEQIQSLNKGGFSPNHSKDMKKIFEDMRANMKEQMGQILLPHQMKRLQEVSVQMEMKNRGDANALMGDRLAEELGIDDEQKKRIEERSEELKKELQEKIEELKRNAREELLKELKPSQRKKLKEMMGDRFEYKNRNWRDEMEKMRRRAKEKAKEADKR